MPRRRSIKVEVTLSLAPGVTATAAKRELRTRCNDLCCFILDEGDVRIQKIAPAAKVASTSSISAPRGS